MAAAVVLLSAAIVFSAQAVDRQAPSRSRDGRLVTTSAAGAASADGLTFGVYPGGAAGAVGPSGGTVAEDPGKRPSCSSLRQSSSVRRRLIGRRRAVRVTVGS
jgi:hypothetical protein